VLRVGALVGEGELAVGTDFLVTFSLVFLAYLDIVLGGFVWRIGWLVGDRHKLVEPATNRDLSSSGSEIQ
jgi:hypothetical protein